MKWIKYIFLFCILIAMFSFCIEFFHPDLGCNSDIKYVLDGQVTDQEGYQSVYVSTTSTMEKPSFNPLSFCKVKIIDNHNNEFDLEEFVNERGHYRVWMGKENLKPETSYKLNVITASGVEIVSDLDQLHESPVIDSIYYIRKDYPTADPSNAIQGIQIYVDFDRKSTNSNYFRWEVVETWEHHAVYPIVYYIDENGKLIHNLSPDYSRFTCWTTEKLKDIFILSTKDILQRKIKMIPINYVNNQTQRLTYCYSILVSQYTISENAFRYWNDLKKNSDNQGGLYNTQPIRVKGNLKCLSNPDLEVFGFFAANSVKSKRLFISSPEKMILCKPTCAPPGKYSDGHYFIEDDSGKNPIGVLDGCVECDYLSGSTIKPNYWPY